MAADNVCQVCGGPPNRRGTYCDFDRFHDGPNKKPAADYAEPLKRAWDRIRCNWSCHDYQKVDNSGKYCKGHAALLEMVDEYTRERGRLIDVRFNEHGRGDSFYGEERRRLRAAVGVDIES